MATDVQTGEDGWLFLTGGQHRVIDLYRAESAFTSAMATGWVELLRERADRLNALGIEYIHLAAPDKLTLLNRHYSEALENPDGSPIRQLVSSYEAQLPNLLNVVPYLSEGIDKYPVFWKTDNHWTAWGCFMAYQLVCSRLKIPTNTEILNYPYSEREAVLQLGRFDHDRQPETVRTYQLNRYSRRVYANQLVRFRENMDLDRLAPLIVDEALPKPDGEQAAEAKRAATRLELEQLAGSLAGEHGSHVIFRNDSANSTDKRVVVFGDSFADYRSQLLTGMLAETVREVHFIWSHELDHEYIRQVRPDIVISEAAEASMTTVPVDQGNVHLWAESQLFTLQAAVEQATELLVELSTPSVPGIRIRRTDLLAAETYQLEAPVVVQEGCDAAHQELAMCSNPVSLVDLDQSRLYFSGERCLLRAANGQKVLEYAVDERREARLWHEDFVSLPGRSFLLAPTPGAHCYYHWMLDILPKLGLLERQGVDLDSIDHFLVRQITGQFQLETLQRLGIDESRIVQTIDRQYLRCENLLHVDMNNGINLKMNRFVPLWLKQMFLPGQANETSIPLDIPDSAPLRLYIGRPEGVRRGIVNEAQIKPIVEAAGFTMVVMEGMSVAQQASLLSRADALMAPHGGALTNMVFCKPGIPVIELLSRHVYPYYYGLAELCGHRYHAILQDPEADFGRLVNHRIAQAYADANLQWQTQNESFSVDIEAVEAMMSKLPALL
ncbi:MAG: DUF563 domain-containing protein [Granulosicoccus sp.]|nr:DUF563 domain-containing protein [Granulosicoccus sp.]